MPVMFKSDELFSPNYDKCRAAQLPGLLLQLHSEHPLEVGKSQFWVKMIYV